MSDGITNLTRAEYDDIRAINATAIDAGRVSMAHMRLTVDGPGKADTAGMKWGRQLHLAVLEPEMFFAGVKVWQGYEKKDGTISTSKNSNAYKEFCEGVDEDMLITQEQLAKLNAISSAVHADKDAHDLIATTQHEITMLWEGDYGKAKARTDMLGTARSGGVIADYKTTKRIVKEAFFRTGYNLGYHVKMGWYAHGYRILTGHTPQVWIIAQEQDAPYTTVVYTVPSVVLQKGEEEAIEVAKAWHVAELTKHYPGPYEGVQEYALPSWAFGGDDAVPEMEE